MTTATVKMLLAPVMDQVNAFNAHHEEMKEEFAKVDGERSNISKLYYYQLERVYGSAWPYQIHMPLHEYPGKIPGQSYLEALRLCEALMRLNLASTDGFATVDDAFIRSLEIINVSAIDHHLDWKKRQLIEETDRFEMLKKLPPYNSPVPKKPEPIATITELTPVLTRTDKINYWPLILIGSAIFTVAMIIANWSH